MFSQAQLNTFGAALDRKRISQATFDEAVQENIEEFDMELEDAIESAIEEFKSQGVDLSGIYTSSGLQNHHVYQISTRMNQSLRSGDLSSLGHTVTSLEEQVDAIIIEGRDTVAFTEIIPVLLSSKTIACFGAGVEALQDDHEVLARFLTLYSKILPLSLDLREEFRVGNYMDAIPFDHSSVHVKCAALSVAGSLAANDESGKGVVMSKNPQKYILEVLELAKEMDHLEAAVESTSALIVPLASADDLTQPSSSAFSNARLLARDGVATSLLAILKMLCNDIIRESSDEKIITTCQLCNGLRLLAANDEICKDLVDQGILESLFCVLKRGLSELIENKPNLAVSGMALLRQMLASDHVKNAVDTMDFINIVSSIQQMYLDDVYTDSSDRVIEHTLGSISAICLRNPDVSEAIVENGCARLIIATMQAMIDRKESNKDSNAPNIGKVLRQGCMSVRNIASRSPSVREVLKSYGAIDVIEHAKSAAKAACTDVGDAAIRDMTA